jgi:hypothetical protein
MKEGLKRYKSFTQVELTFNGARLKIPHELLEANDFETKLKELLIRNGIEPTKEKIEELKRKIEEFSEKNTILTIEEKTLHIIY